VSADVETTLDECLARLDRGENLDACLAAFPALAADLRPLLEMAGGLRAAAPPRASREAVAAGKQRVMVAFAAKPPAHVIPASTIWQNLAGALRHALRPPGPTPSWYALRFALAIFVVLGFGTTGAVAVSAHSLPGDVLYPVKQSIENFRLVLTLDGPSRQRLETQFESERLLEVQALLQLRRQQSVEFAGVLRAMGDNGNWVVGPFGIQVHEGTLVSGRPVLGSRVVVEARIQSDGTLLALRVTQAEAHGHEPEHRSGPDQTQFVSPLPATPPTLESEHEESPGAEDDHVEEPGHQSERQAAPTIGAYEAPLSEPETDHDATPTVQPRARSSTSPTHQAEPTGISHDTGPAAAPTPTREPSHASTPAAGPQDHVGAPTEQPPHQDPAPHPSDEPRHSEPSPDDGSGGPEGRH
jgi:hypothetical protein